MVGTQVGVKVSALPQRLDLDDDDALMVIPTREYKALHARVAAQDAEISELRTRMTSIETALASALARIAELVPK